MSRHMTYLSWRSDVERDPSLSGLSEEGPVPVQRQPRPDQLPLPPRDLLLVPVSGSPGPRCGEGEIRRSEVVPEVLLQFRWSNPHWTPNSLSVPPSVSPFHKRGETRTVRLGNPPSTRTMVVSEIETVSSFFPTPTPVPAHRGRGVEIRQLVYIFRVRNPPGRRRSSMCRRLIPARGPSGGGNSDSTGPPLLLGTSGLD